MIYLDSSAIVKLAREERESSALREWLSRHPQELASSALSEVEVRRALRRAEPGALDTLDAVTARVGSLDLDGEIRRAAAAVGSVDLRSLDAIHLASALSLAAPDGSEELDALITYDRRLAAAARSAGLTVVAPGASPPV